MSSLSRHAWVVCLTFGITAAVFVFSTASATAGDKEESASRQISGEEIFRREWLPNDPRSHGGDGLGPVFNESSCVACHSQGGVGGGGPADKNVHLLTSTMLGLEQLQLQMKRANELNPQAPEEIERQHRITSGLLVELHPGFKSSNTIVLHRFGVDPKHATWLKELSSGELIGLNKGTISNAKMVKALRDAQTGSRSEAVLLINEAATLATDNQSGFPVVGKIAVEINSLQDQARTSLVSPQVLGITNLLRSQRNTTALFGAGLIDAIPDEAITAAAGRPNEDFPRISGRVNRLQGGRVGRFGWKAQEASLYDFTMTACAVEVGLHVPDQSQSIAAYQRESKPAGFDLNRKQVVALVGYVSQFPRPLQRSSSHAEVALRLNEGEKLFESIGCAACHIKQLGNVSGLFSDLLLHDMGPDLGAMGSYYGVPTSPPIDPEPLPLAKSGDKNTKPLPPTAQEWRTPPLWGVRDSAPYLHDGRAATLEQAIAFHGGEAADARARFFMQTPSRRQKIIAFLKSLTAPDAVAGR